ncbi:flavonol synthase, putative [Ricinus communis]|uniref:Flavonol synthase, putative n=1 Tax=Ricinus communis TaxID=3988 RepID=B9RJ58_RICCO|nr:flavonol synthase, putative [Ricinus communis]
MSLPRDVLVNEVNKACSQWGFFLVTDHGVPLSLIQHLKEVGQEIFALPQEEKEVCANDPTSGRFEGYGTKMTKNRDEKIEWVEYFYHVIAPVSRVNYDLWPENPPYREVTEEYKREMVRMANELLKLLSEGLGVGRKCLQVWKDDKWAASYLPDALFIHVGNRLQVLSNGKYESVFHRSLVDKEKMRMSWAMFITPPHEAVIGSVAKLLDDQNPPKYCTKTFFE